MPTIGEQAGDAQLELGPFDMDELAATLPDEPAADEAAVVEPHACWPEPESLLRMLDELPCGDSPAHAAWRDEVRGSFARMAGLTTLDDPQAAAELRQLSEAAARSASLAGRLDEPSQVLVRRIGHGIRRRVAVWQAVHQLASDNTTLPTAVVSDMLPVLAAAQRRLAAAPRAAEGWRTYLMLDKLQELATETWEPDGRVRWRTARTVLERMTDRGLTAEQQRFLQDPSLDRLRHELRNWAVEPIDASAMLYTLERFEAARSGALAQQVSEFRDALGWHPAVPAASLRQNLDAHYRNANIRLAISGQLINDLLPVLRPLQEKVRDNILGAEVLGQNRTWTDLKVRLIEDDRNIRLRFEAAGQTRSRTVSMVGPIRFFSAGQSQFQAGKDLMITRDGIYVQRATAAADGQAKLLDVETDYDAVPLLGWLLRQVAIDEHDERRGVVRNEFSQRVSRAASWRLEDTVNRQLLGAEQKVDQKVLEPLRRLKLDPQALEMRTTAERIVLRSRIAGATQLAAYTPRPQAVQDAVLSLQVHESAANNLLQQLHLEGKRIDVPELMVCLSQKLHIERADIHEDLPEDASVRLGYDRPIEVEFDADRVLFTFRIAELSTGKKTWHNFIVRGRYRADVTRLSVDLSREGGIELISDDLGIRDQVALRGIFTKVMTRNHRLNLLRDRFAQDQRLANLVVSQFQVRDGWIGVSISPHRREHVAAEPSAAVR